MGRRTARPPVRSGTDAPLMPGALRERLRVLLGDEIRALEEALAERSPTSIRLNPYKPFPLEAEAVPWCTNGRYLNERPAFTLDPFLHAGAYYVQEASSMFLEQALVTSGLLGHDLLALDLCAAPGGKSTHLLSLLSEGSLLVANEVEPGRRHILAENIWKQGAGNAVISGSDPSALRSLPELFDLIVIDAPCSGGGMLRKDPFARQQWSPALVAACARTQHDIVAHAWSALSPGGLLIYSTCTWEQAENEDQVRTLVELGGECLEIPLDPSWGVVRSDAEGVIGYRCYPHRVRGEGFFLCAIRKPGGRNAETRKPVVATTAPQPEGLSSPWEFRTKELDGVRYAYPASWAEMIERIARAMRMHAPGTPWLEKKGDAWVPHPAAALSRLLDRKAFNKIELDAAQAIAYLSGGTIAAENASGTALVTHRGMALGWVHGAGRRWNNRWPSPWRIRAQRSAAPRVSWHMS